MKDKYRFLSNWAFPYDVQFFFRGWRGWSIIIDLTFHSLYVSFIILHIFDHYVHFLDELTVIYIIAAHELAVLNTKHWEHLLSLESLQLLEYMADLKVLCY